MENNSNAKKAKKKEGLFQRLLNYVERVGNKLPQPVTLFFILIVIVLLLSWITSFFDLSAVHPGTGEEIKAINLLNGDGIQRIFTQMVTTFANLIRFRRII